MKNFFKLSLKVLLGKNLIRIITKGRNYFFVRKGYRSFAQEGEDRVLFSLLFKLHGGKHIDNGFYVDVGAHHPYYLSNTYIFYRQGWRGLNIDAMPGSMALFEKNRPRDINLESGVGGGARH